MKHLILLLSVWLVGSFAYGVPTPEQPDRNISEYNLDGNLAFKGYDPVAVFPEGGGAALAGDSSLSVEYGGLVYYFANEANKMAFMENPTKYEPTYGGWCAWAMSNNRPINIDPKIFTIHGNRAHYFISRGAKARFDIDLEAREELADNFWMERSGEEPRQ